MVSIKMFPGQSGILCYNPLVRMLPLKLLVMGDYTLRDDDTPIEEMKPINITANTIPT